MSNVDCCKLISRIVSGFLFAAFVLWCVYLVVSLMMTCPIVITQPQGGSFMKHLFLLENQDLLDMKSGERMTMNINGIEFLLGYLGSRIGRPLKIAEQLEEDHDDEEEILPPPRALPSPSNGRGRRHGNKRRAPCPFCKVPQGVSGMWTHVRAKHATRIREFADLQNGGRHAIKRDRGIQPKKPCPVCKKLIGTSGRYMHIVRLHPEYAAEQKRLQQQDQSSRQEAN